MIWDSNTATLLKLANVYIHAHIVMKNYEPTSAAVFLHRVTYCKVRINWGEVDPDSREARLIAVAPGVESPKLNVPSLFT